MYALQQEVIHAGRPAVIITQPEVGATGATLYGIRYTDVPRWEAVPGFPDMRKPATGSCAIARENDLTTL